MTISAEQHHWLELKIGKCKGDAFQDFFSSVMENLHGDLKDKCFNRS